MSASLDRRRLAVRQRQLLLALEQWGPAYVGRVTQATDEEMAWLKQHGIPTMTVRDAAEWNQIRRDQGRQANAAASAAFAAGDYARARDLIDEARAFGAVTDLEWQNLHRFVDQKAGPEAGQEARPEAAPAAEMPAAAA
ncbi:hypothetical protein AB0J83_40755 [Actinoplanes sp. NPDC049596]|uniref:hypothetical protein n=1 Tax=unclassified Actinoplanes TaxID=2626549 RepID=UPI0034295D88